MEFQDKKLICRDCSKEFVWTAGEQKFFSDKGFTNAPIRCADCRKKKRGKFGEEKQSTVVEEFHEIKCAKCNKSSEIPFKPQDPDSILCGDCFEKSLSK